MERLTSLCRWRAAAAFVGASAIVCALPALLSQQLRLKRRKIAEAEEEAEAALSPAEPIPEKLVAGAVRGDCVAVIGEDFLAGLPGGPPSLASALLQIAEENGVATSGTVHQLSSGSSPPREVLDAFQHTLVEAAGRPAIVRGLRRTLRLRGRGSADAPPVLQRRLQALKAAPISAMIVEGWDNVLEKDFPRRVNRNFGGFQAILARPAIDSLQARATPLLSLRGTLDDADSLLLSQKDFQAVASKDGLAGFLRDLFVTKTVILLGYDSPPAGLLGDALRAHAALVATATGAPLGYLVLNQGELLPATRAAWLREYGLYAVTGGYAACLECLSKAHGGAPAQGDGR